MHYGGIDKDFDKIYYCIRKDDNRYTTFNLLLSLSLRHWGLGPTLYIGKGWQIGLHLLCFHIEASGWFKKR